MEFERETMHMLMSEEFSFFSNVQDLVDAFVMVQTIDMEYFRNQFIYLVVFYLLILFLFLIEVSLKLSLKKIIRILDGMKLRLRRYRFNLRMKILVRCPTFEFF